MWEILGYFSTVAEVSKNLSTLDHWRKCQSPPPLNLENPYPQRFPGLGNHMVQMGWMIQITQWLQLQNLLSSCTVTCLHHMRRNLLQHAC
ncbi:hypothetical protein Nepgr_002551 [Nepenthes gracilis]|uniref:Uncharacterized protein n=1 Tax=Nepenthes gracilis TaxID=150966 RepID=A0AAD3PA38_NEPGR|nr:hypothetical protein Nepgr_002551 [Nepenthes gracilis]